MKFYHRLFPAIILLITILSGSCSTESNRPFPEGVKRIVFLGNSITYSGKYIEDIEAYFVTHYPQHKYEFINLGLPSETVSGLSEEGHANGEFPRPCLFSRLDNLLEKAKPDMAFVCYGMNDGIYLPLDEGRFDKYKEGVSKLYGRLRDAGVKEIVLLTPPMHDDKEKGIEGYDRTLGEYSRWLVSETGTNGWAVIDIHSVMGKYLLDRRQTEPEFRLADDGVHPGELGHWLIAREILSYLGQDVAQAGSVSETFSGIVNAGKIYGQVKMRQQYSKDAWLTHIGHQRPKMRTGMPMDQLERLNADIDKEIEALRAGKTRIVISCIGNSITQGVGVKYPVLDSYPAQLQRLLGHDNYEVLNFGVSGTTMLSSTDRAYTATDKYREFLESDPDIATIKLGTNDSRMPFRVQIVDSLTIQAERLVASVKNLPRKPRIIMILPVSCFLTDPERQSDSILISQVIPRLKEIAEDENLEIIDMHTATAGSINLFPDLLHPNEQGMRMIADSVYNVIIRGQGPGSE